jgi:hypothetical protein
MLGITSSARCDLANLSTRVKFHISREHDSFYQRDMLSLHIQDTDGVVRRLKKLLDEFLQQFHDTKSTYLDVLNGSVLNSRAIASNPAKLSQDIEGLDQLTDRELKYVHQQVMLRSNLMKALVDPTCSVEGFQLDSGFYDDIKQCQVRISEHSRDFRLTFPSNEQADQFMDKYSNEYKVIGQDDLSLTITIDENEEASRSLSVEPSLYRYNNVITVSSPPRSHLDTAIALGSVNSDLFIIC